MEVITKVVKQFSTTGFIKYLLFNSTLVNNYKVIYFINYKSLLVKGSFWRAKAGNHIQTGTSLFPISGYGK